MAGFMTNLAAGLRGFSNVQDKNRQRAKEDAHEERLKKQDAFNESQRALQTALSQQQMDDLAFNKELNAATVDPADTALDPDSRMLKRVTKARDFALEKGRVDVAEKYDGALESLKQKYVEKSAGEAFRTYQTSGDLNDLVKPFGLVNDGRKNFRFDGDDTKGYTLSYEMADGTKRALPFKSKDEAAESAYHYIKPLERMKNEIEYRQWARKQGELNDGKLAQLDANNQTRLEIALAKMRADLAGGSSSGGSRQASGVGAGEGGIYGDAAAVKKEVDLVVAGLPDDTPYDPTQVAADIQRFRANNPGVDMAGARLAARRLIENPASTLVAADPNTGELGVYVQAKDGRKYRYDSLEQAPQLLRKKDDAGQVSEFTPEEANKAVAEQTLRAKQAFVAGQAQRDPQGVAAIRSTLFRDGVLDQSRVSQLQSALHEAERNLRGQGKNPQLAGKSVDDAGNAIDLNVARRNLNVATYMAETTAAGAEKRGGPTSSAAQRVERAKAAGLAPAPLDTFAAGAGRLWDGAVGGIQRLRKDAELSQGKYLAQALAAGGKGYNKSPVTMAEAQELAAIAKKYPDEIMPLLRDVPEAQRKALGL